MIVFTPNCHAIWIAKPPTPPDPPVMSALLNAKLVMKRTPGRPSRAWRGGGDLRRDGGMGG